MRIYIKEKIFGNKNFYKLQILSNLKLSVQLFSQKKLLNSCKVEVKEPISSSEEIANVILPK